MAKFLGQLRADDKPQAVARRAHNRLETTLATYMGAVVVNGKLCKDGSVEVDILFTSWAGCEAERKVLRRGRIVQENGVSKFVDED